MGRYYDYDGGGGGGGVEDDKFIMEQERYSIPSFLLPFKMDVNDSAIMDRHGQCLQAKCPRIRIFGYGSLMWNPNFEYDSCQIGYIEDYERKFNQGNVTFRGTKDRPGRVANLEEKKGSKVWGVAFEVCGRENILRVLRYLYEREITCGGYEVISTSFCPRDTRSRCQRPSHPDLSNVQQITAEHREHAPSHVHNMFPCPSEPSQKCVEHRDNYFHPCLSNAFEDNAIDLCDIACCNSNSDGNLEDGTGCCQADDKHETHHRISKDNYNAMAKDSNNVKITESFNNSKTSLNPLREFNSTTSVQSDDQDASTLLEVIVFTPTRDNHLYLGATRTMGETARQIVQARGTAGDNVEYILRISDYIQRYIQEDNDTFLFDLVDKIKEELRLNQMRVVS